MSTVRPALAFERSFYVGNTLEGFYIGLQTYMCVHSLYLLNRHKGISRKTKYFYICFGFIMLLLSVCQWIGNSFEGQLMWIDHGSYPGGPAAYFDAEAAAWFSVLSTVVSVLQTFMNDALLLYRCYIIWNGKIWILVLPVIVFIASTVSSIITLIQSSSPNGGFLTAALTVPWILLSSSLNIILTVLIAGRILHKARWNAQLFSDGNHRLSIRPYTTVVTILVESALPLCLIGVVLSVFLVRKLPYNVCLAITYGSFVALAPQLIILRVAMRNSAEIDNLTGDFITSPIRFNGEKRTRTFGTCTERLEEGILVGC